MFKILLVPSRLVCLLIAFVRTPPNLVFLWYKDRNFTAITGDYRLAAPNNFIRGITAAGNCTPLSSISFPLVSFFVQMCSRIRRPRIHNPYPMIITSLILTRDAGEDARGPGEMGRREKGRRRLEMFCRKFG